MSGMSDVGAAGLRRTKQNLCQHVLACGSTLAGEDPESKAVTAMLSEFKYEPLYDLWIVGKVSQMHLPAT